MVFINFDKTIQDGLMVDWELIVRTKHIGYITEKT